MPDNTIYRKNYLPPAFTVETIALDFDLYDDHALVTNTMQLKRQSVGDLFLYGDELELISICINELALDKETYHRKKDDLIIENCPDELTLKIITKLYPQNNTQLSGLYRSNQLFCTQCEAEGFRRITFYPDRPDVLATFTTRISADKQKYPILLSNGNLIDAGNLDEKRHWTLWQDPFKKPSYLFALVAGDLACVKDEFTTCSGKVVDLRIYVESGNEDKCTHAMESLKKSMRWDEEVYGREYDLSVFMIVAVSDFNMGAMENKGLNIFNSKYILASPDTATDQDFADIEAVVAHEYFHNWTGNRITCRDWFQLSLKEGLTVFRDQEFSRDMNSRDVNRILDVKTLRTNQFPEDASSMAHPVRPESYQEINNFYTSTIYEKGAEVIRMQHTLLGAAGFRQGMDLYFERHDGQAVTIDNFVAAMEDANQVDFSQFKRWYSQAGTPEISVQSTYSEGCLQLSMSQSCPITADGKEKQPFHIPLRLAFFDAQGCLLQEDVLELKDKEQIFSFSHLKSKPIVSLLRDFSAPVKLKRTIDTQELLALLRFETNGFAKWDAAQRLALDCIGSYFKQNESDWSISNDLVVAYQQILLDESLDPALRAELITPPGFEEIAASLNIVDVDKVAAARNFFRATLGTALFETLETTYKRLWKEEDHAMHAAAFGRRKLRNICLFLLMKASETKALDLCQQQFSQAKTMTDQIASFAALCNCSDNGKKAAAIEQFYKQWSKNDLVMDKWFSIQATSEIADSLNQVKALLKHPAFSIKNPNKVRSVIAAFSQLNPVYFHALDGSGYRFLSEMLQTVDKINPQIAARLATPFTRWQRYDKTRQSLMQNELRLLAALELSGDLREMVEQSLVV